MFFQNAIGRTNQEKCFINWKCLSNTYHNKNVCVYRLKMQDIFYESTHKNLILKKGRYGSVYHAKRKCLRMLFCSSENQKLKDRSFVV